MFLLSKGFLGKEIVLYYLFIVDYCGVRNKKNTILEKVTN